VAASNSFVLTADEGVEKFFLFTHTDCVALLSGQDLSVTEILKMYYTLHGEKRASSLPPPEAKHWKQTPPPTPAPLLDLGRRSALIHPDLRAGHNDASSRFSEVPESVLHDCVEVYLYEQVCTDGTLAITHSANPLAKSYRHVRSTDMVVGLDGSTHIIERTNAPTYARSQSVLVSYDRHGERNRIDCYPGYDHGVRAVSVNRNGDVLTCATYTLCDPEDIETVISFYSAQTMCTRFFKDIKVICCDTVAFISDTQFAIVYDGGGIDVYDINGKHVGVLLECITFDIRKPTDESTIPRNVQFRVMDFRFNLLLQQFVVLAYYCDDGVRHEFIFLLHPGGEVIRGIAFRKKDLYDHPPRSFAIDRNSNALVWDGRDNKLHIVNMHEDSVCAKVVTHTTVRDDYQCDLSAIRCVGVSVDNYGTIYFHCGNDGSRREATYSGRAPRHPQYPH
jgi:hypothetical protein